MQGRKGRQCRLEAVRQIVGRRGQGHDGGSDDEIEHADHHDDSIVDSGVRDGDGLPLKDRISRREEYIENSSDQDQNHDGPEALRHEGKRHVGQPDDQNQKARDQDEGGNIVHDEEGNDPDQGPHELDPGVHIVEEAVRRVILSDCYITKHLLCSRTSNTSQLLCRKRTFTVKNQVSA